MSSQNTNIQSKTDFLNVMRLVDSRAAGLRIMHKHKMQDNLEEVYEFLSNDDNMIHLSHIIYPAIAYKEIKRVMGVSIKEYERIFAHTWRGIAQKQDYDSVDRSYSERLLSILRIYAQGIAVFGDPDKLNTWLSSHNRTMAAEPRELLDTILGCGKISDELGRIEHGLLA